MDIVMPGKLDGIAAAQIIKEEQDIPVIFLTAYADNQFIERAKHVEPFGYIVKPFQEGEIKATIEVALYKKEVEKELQRAHDELGRRVEQRTAELKKANEELKAEIAERKLAEEMARESEARWHTLIENAPDIISTVDREGRIMFINYAPPGLTAEDALGTNALDYVMPEHRETVKQSIQRVFQTGVPDSYEIAARGPRGTTSWYMTRLGPIKHNGEIVAAMLITRDITERKQAEQALREREAELEIKTNSLEEVNTALRVLLRRREEDKAEIEEKVLLNVRELVVPFLERLKKSQLDPKQLSYTDILESNLNDIISPFSRTLSAKYLSLTPKEIQIANLIKQGKSTKDIGELMALSPRTIETHRKSLRKKLGLEKKKSNLRSRLLTFR
jgi:PAS domain S-box-containing protein